MQFIFFDIECACVSRNAARICAFGYCIADENFNLIEKSDILINPQGNFHLTDRKGERGIVLPYDYKKFTEYPKFSYFYKKIGKLLSGDRLIVGHSILNDVKFLNLETQRYHLPYIDYSFYDTQTIYMNKVGQLKRQFSLGGIAESLGVEFTAHRAADDAFATMKIAEAMCREDNLTFPALLEKYGMKAGFTKGGEITPSYSQKQWELLKKEECEKSVKKEKHFAFLELLASLKADKEGDLAGRVFNFHKDLEEDFERAKNYLLRIYRRGGRYASSMKCNVYIRAEGEASGKLTNALKNNAMVLKEEDLKEMLKQETLKERGK